MTDPGLLDETYTRLRATGPEFDGWLSNHAPMVAEAMVRLGRSDDVSRWVDTYLPRLQDAPSPRWAIGADGWREPLGDPSRLGDWRTLLAREVEDAPWESVLARWWPRLLPGAAASAAHGLIRTGHAVRSLREHDSAARRGELAEALAYWAARWLPVHPPGRPAGVLAPAAALDGLPSLGSRGGFRTRLADVAASTAWPGAAAALGPGEDTDDVPGALQLLVDAAVDRYAGWGHAAPVMLVHAATAPRAAALVLPSLPHRLWPLTYDAAWAVTAAVVCCYRPQTTAPHRSDATLDAHDAVDRAVRLGDPHAVKFVETALEPGRAGSVAAVAAAHRAVTLIAQET